MSDEPVTERKGSRLYVHPRGGDSLRDIAERELPELTAEKGVEQLLLWNLHLTNRVNAVGTVGEILPSDIVFVAPRVTT